MVITANELGLKEIGVTDHGFAHIFGTNKEKLIAARELIDEINTWSKTKVLLGVEADIISEDGTIDIDADALSLIDILLVGYHKVIRTDFAGFLGGQKGEDAEERATNAYINAIEKYPVTILVHPGSILKVDMYKIGCACRDKGVMVEINNRHLTWTEEDVMNLLASECMFVVSSDAHSREKVGEVDKAFELIKKYDIPSELVANVEFEENERSERDKESDMYYGIYKQKQEEKLQKQKELEKSKDYEFSNKISKEMEDALAKIAQEKGLEYTEEPTYAEEEDKSYFYQDAETKKLLEEAEEYINSFDGSKNVETPEIGAEIETEKNALIKSENENNEPENEKQESQEQASELTEKVDEENLSNETEKPDIEENTQKTEVIEENTQSQVESVVESSAEPEQKQEKKPAKNEPDFGRINSILRATEEANKNKKD